MARPARPERNRSARSSRQLSRFYHSINPDRVFGTHRDFVFPGGRKGVPISNMAMAEVLKRMGRLDITVHGFRSTFRDWAAERTSYPNHVVEMALAHVVGNKVEAAYRRGDLIAKRARLMGDWAKYCMTRPV